MKSNTSLFFGMNHRALLSAFSALPAFATLGPVSALAQAGNLPSAALAAGDLLESLQYS